MILTLIAGFQFWLSGSGKE